MAITVHVLPAVATSPQKELAGGPDAVNRRYLVCDTEAELPVNGVGGWTLIDGEMAYTLDTNRTWGYRITSTGARMWRVIDSDELAYAHRTSNMGTSGVIAQVSFESDGVRETVVTAYCAILTPQQSTSSVSLSLTDDLGAYGASMGIGFGSVWYNTMYHWRKVWAAGTRTAYWSFGVSGGLGTMSAGPGDGTGGIYVPPAWIKASRAR